MRDVQLLARALAGECGSVVRTTDELRIVVRLRPLHDDLGAIYLPPRSRDGLAALAIDPDLGGVVLDRMRLLAIAHLVLRHDTLPAYGWTSLGTPVFDADGDAAEALAFANAFELALPACRYVPDFDFEPLRFPLERAR